MNTDKITRIADLKTVDLHTLTWFDRVNGNTYFASRIVLNYGMDNEETLTLPFQYGYGSQDEWEMLATLQKRFKRADLSCHWKLRDKYRVIVRCNKHKAKKRECEALANGCPV